MCCTSLDEIRDGDNQQPKGADSQKHADKKPCSE